MASPISNRLTPAHVCFLEYRRRQHSNAGPRLFLSSDYRRRQHSSTGPRLFLNSDYKRRVHSNAGPRLFLQTHLSQTSKHFFPFSVICCPFEIVCKLSFFFTVSMLVCAGACVCACVCVRACVRACVLACVRACVCA